MKYAFLLLAALGLGACGISSGSDPVYAALRANPPTSIPSEHLSKLRQGRASCDVFNRGKSSQYMTCWWPGGKPTSAAYLSYYGGGLQRPNPNNLIAPGGKPVTEYIKLP